MSEFAQNEQILLGENPRLCAAARAILDWSQDDLAKMSGVARRTISDFELGRRIPHQRLLRDLMDAFERSGVAFLARDESSILLIEFNASIVNN